MKLPTPMAFKYELLWLRLFFLLITIWSILYSLISARLLVKTPPEKKIIITFISEKCQAVTLLMIRKNGTLK